MAQNLSVKGTSMRAADIADRGDVCPWNPDMYGVDMIEYAIPGGAVRFRAFAAIDDGALTQPTGATVRFSVHVLPPPEPADPAGATVRVSLSELGLSGRWAVRDLWERRDIGTVDAELAPIVAWHGAALYRLSPRP